MANFDSSITAHFGGDTSGLASAVTQSETLVAGMEKRFEQMGIQFGNSYKKSAEESAKAFSEIEQQQTEFARAEMERSDKVAKKKAQDSADVFEQIFRGEEQLRQFHFRKLSDSDKLKMLQSEAAGIRERILALDGRSVEKVGLQVEYQKKLTSIYDLNQKITAESAAAQGNITAEGQKQNKEYKGVSGVLDQIKDGFKAIGVSLKGAGIGVAIALAVAEIRKAIDGAQKLRDELEKAKMPVNDTTAALAILGDGIDNLRKGVGEFVGFAVGAFAKIGANAGEAINQLRGITVEQQKYREEAEKLGAVAEAAKIARRQEQYDAEKIRAMRKEAAEAEKAYQMSRADAEAQFQLQLDKHFELIRRIGVTQKDTLQYQVLQKQLAESKVALNAKELALINEIAEKQLASITKWAPLAESIDEKRAVLKQQEKVLLTQIAELQDKGYKTTEAQGKLDAIRVSQVQLESEYIEKMKGDMATRLEIARLEQKAKSGLNELESANLALLRKQLEEQQAQLKFSELLAKQLRGELTPAEEVVLEALRRQLIALGLQREEIEKIVSATKGITPAVQTATAAVHDQGAAWDKINGKVEKVKGEAIKLQGILAGIENASNFGNEPTSVLQEKIRRNNTAIADLERNKRTGPLSIGANSVDDLEIARLKLTNKNLQEEINLRNTTLKNIDTRGEKFALSKFPGIPEAFDNFVNVARGQDVTLKDISKDITTIKNIFKDVTKK